MPAAALRLFNIKLLPILSNSVTGMQFQAQLHLGIDIPVLCARTWHPQ
jgi:hypothetical protein